MTSFRVFCLEEELSTWVAMLCSKYHLSLLAFPADSEGSIWFETCTDGVPVRGAYRVFLGKTPPVRVSSLKEIGDVNQKGWGWLSITHKGVRKVNGESQLVMSDLSGTDLPGTKQKPVSQLRWLMTTLRKQKAIISGVAVRDESDEASSINTSIYYTPAAAALLSKGITWRALDTGSRLIYSPAKP